MKYQLRSPTPLESVRMLQVRIAAVRDYCTGRARVGGYLTGGSCVVMSWPFTDPVMTVHSSILSL
jgi:hypothetical protein